MNFAVVNWLQSLMSKRRTRWLIVQKRNRMVNALASADSALTHMATCAVSEAKSEKKWPMSMKNGAPGGCPTSSFQALEMNSPQSQNEAVGSIVRRYVTAATAKTSHPQSVFHNLKFLNFYCCFLFLGRI